MRITQLFIAVLALIVVSLLVWAVPVQGQPLEVSADLPIGIGGDRVSQQSQLPSQAEHALRIIDNGFESEVEQSDLLAGRLTVENFLTTQGYVVAPEDVVFPQRSEPLPQIGTIIIRRAPGVEIIYDDKTENFKTQSLTVKDLLKERGIEVGEDDRVEPGLESAIVPNMRVQIYRVKYEEIEEDEEIVFETEYRDDPDKYEGEVVVHTDGENGLKNKKFKLTIEDGEEIDKELLSEDVVKEPVTKIILQGTKKKPVYKPPTSGGGGDYWSFINAAASQYGVDAQDMYNIMMCESGGNPNADNGYGNLGLFQFAQSTFDSWNVIGGSIWDPKSQVYAAAALIAAGGRGAWPHC